MKKRRKFAEKLKVAVCLLSVIASTLFYAPMDVKASVSSDTSSGSFSGQTQTSNMQLFQPPKSIALESATNYLKGLAPGFYKIDYSGNIAFVCDSNSRMASLGLILRYGTNRISLFSGYVGSGTSDSGWTKNYNVPFSGSFIIEVNSSTDLDYHYSGNLLFEGVGKFKLDHTLKINFNSVSKLAQTDSEQYQQGYQAGLAEGQKQGYNNGYSEGFAKGENEGYDKGFQAGVGSVDTDSIYEAGRKAGYDAGYQKGYDDGHKAGYDEAMERIESWGADTTKYPLYIDDIKQKVRFYYYYNSSLTYPYDLIDLDDSWGIDTTGESIDPNHVYRIDFVIPPLKSSLGSDVAFSDFELFYVLGGVRYSLGTHDYYRDVPIQDFIYVDGVNMSGSPAFEGVLRVQSDFSHKDGTFTYDFDSVTVKFYDMGPKGNTQNHIANQTDQLTNGFDNSAGNASHDKFQGSVNEYEAAEGSLFATATENIAKFEFFDFQSIAAVMTGITFVTSTMTKIFNLSGGISGVGIILSVLFSVMLVAMALGLYKRYQSTGHGSSGTGNTDKSDKGGGK